MDTVVPKLILQPIVENAIVHGIWQDDCGRFNNPDADNPFGYI